MNWSVSIPIMSPTVMMAAVTTFENHGASLYSLHCAKMYSRRSSVNDNSYEWCIVSKDATHNGNKQAAKTCNRIVSLVTLVSKAKKGRNGVEKKNGARRDSKRRKWSAKLWACYHFRLILFIPLVPESQPLLPSVHF
jgi:hypothetical protein